jgi:hypothetical protein
MSELAVGSLSGLAANSYVIDVASGSQLTQPGMVLQVVSTTKTDTFSAAISTKTFSSNITGLEATITPSSTSSKIFVSYVVTGARTVEVDLMHIRLVRDGSAISVGDAAGSRTRVSGGIYSGAAASTVSSGQISGSFLDSPSSTTALTYGLQLFNNGGGTNTVFVNRTDDDSDADSQIRSVSTITVMEIAG